MTKNQNPQPTNPYQSVIVSASAGAGKTFQLSQRYLRLVIAGANPADILTVTFTRKAAAEMKKRIFEDAVAVLADSQLADEIDIEMRGYYSESKQHETHLRVPRTAARAAEVIINSSQSLKIQTIDSLFQELVLRFPVEAGAHLPIPFRIGNTIEKKELYEAAYLRLFEEAEKPDGEPGLRQLLADYLTWPESTVAALQADMMYLQREYLFLLEVQQRQGEGWSQFLLDPVPGYGDYSAQDILHELQSFFARVAEKLRPKDRAALLDTEGPLSSTRDPKILRGILFKKGTWDFLKKISDPLEPEETQGILTLCYELQRRILNKRAQTIFKLYEIYHTYAAAMKKEMQLIDFDDLSIGAYNLFYGENSFGARYHLFLRVSHLLVDEFQDTSRIQWHIFSAMADELLAGEGLAAENGIQPTVFFVGDAKQSIYAFRQGDYRLLREAISTLGDRFGVHPTSLDRSWRSSNLILAQVNKVFQAPEYAHLLDAFQDHQTAEVKGKPVAPASGSFTLLKPVEKSKGETIAEVRQRQAQQLVTLIENWIRDEKPIFDRERGCYRPLQYGDIGILYRKSILADELERSFIRAGIPYIKEEKKGYYKRREISDILAFLSFMAMHNDDIAVATLLRSPLLRLRDQDFMALLAVLQQQAPARRQSLYSLLATHHPAIHQKLAFCIQQIGHWSLDRIVTHFIEETKAFAAYRLSLGEKEGQLAEANLLQLVEILATAWPPGSGSILDYLEMVKNFKGVDETGNAQLKGNSITLMTMHKAKGLEFPVVMLLGAEQPIGSDGKADSSGFRKSLNQREKQFVYLGRTKQDRLPEIEENLRILRAHEEDERKEGMRLLYVALTRAKEHFVASAAGACGAESYQSILQMSIFRENPEAWQEIFPDIEALTLQADIDARFDQPLQTSPPEKKEIKIPDFQTKILARGIRIVHPSENVLEATIAGADDFEEAPEPETTPASLSVADLEKRRITGTLIHAGLQARIQHNPWDIKRQLAVALQTSLHFFSEHDTAAMQKTINEHLNTSWQSAALQTLLEGAVKIYTELPLLHLKERTLVHGFADLVIEKPDQTWLIDFKSTSIKGKDVEALIQERGHARQLQYYADALEKILPDNGPVTKALFFTESGFLRTV